MRRDGMRRSSGVLKVFVVMTDRLSEDWIKTVRNEISSHRRSRSRMDGWVGSSLGPDDKLPANFKSPPKTTLKVSQHIVKSMLKADMM